MHRRLLDLGSHPFKLIFLILFFFQFFSSYIFRYKHMEITIGNNWQCKHFANFYIYWLFKLIYHLNTLSSSLLSLSLVTIIHKNTIFVSPNTIFVSFISCSNNLFLLMIHLGNCYYFLSMLHIFALYIMFPKCSSQLGFDHNIWTLSFHVFLLVITT